MKGQMTDEKSRFKPKTSLFTRIQIRLVFPLFFLGAVFAAIQLTNQINTMNQVYRIESQLTFQGIQRTLTRELASPANMAYPKKFKEKVGKLVQFHSIETIDLYNFVQKTPFLPGESFTWSRVDANAAEASIIRKETDDSYHVRVDSKERQLIAYMAFEGPSIEQVIIARIPFPLANVKAALENSRWALGIMFFFIGITGFAIGHSLTSSIVKPIKTLNTATREIMRGKLGGRVDVKTGDEIEMLAETFNKMSTSLKDMKQQAVDANPLTGLPGNQGIFHEVQRRIHERQKFVFFHVDLDRFKVFNDHFGLAKGDEAIKRTADFLRKLIEKEGGQNAFVGHQGGDDFVIIAQPQRAERIGEQGSGRYKEEVVSHLYSREDFERGHILELDRRRQTRTGEKVMAEFPLLSLSLAGVSNINRDFADYFDCMNRVAPIKKEVKKIIESCYKIQE